MEHLLPLPLPLHLHLHIHLLTSKEIVPPSPTLTGQAIDVPAELVTSSKTVSALLPTSTQAMIFSDQPSSFTEYHCCTDKDHPIAAPR